MELWIKFSEAIANFEKNGFDPNWKDCNFPQEEIFSFLYALGHHIGSTKTINGQLGSAEIEIGIGLFRAGIIDGQAQFIQALRNSSLDEIPL